MADCSRNPHVGDLNPLSGIKLALLFQTILPRQKGTSRGCYRYRRRLSGNRHKKGAIKTTRIGGTAKAHEQNPELYLANLATVVGYVIKGICANAGATLQLERINGQGRVIGKRCCQSANI